MGVFFFFKIFILCFWESYCFISIPGTLCPRDAISKKIRTGTLQSGRVDILPCCTVQGGFVLGGIVLGGIVQEVMYSEDCTGGIVQEGVVHGGSVQG